MDGLKSVPDMQPQLIQPYAQSALDKRYITLVLEHTDSNKIKEFIKNCLQIDLEKRLSAQDAVKLLDPNNDILVKMQGSSRRDQAEESNDSSSSSSNNKIDMAEYNDINVLQQKILDSKKRKGTTTFLEHLGGKYGSPKTEKKSANKRLRSSVKANKNLF